MIGTGDMARAIRVIERMKQELLIRREMASALKLVVASGRFPGLSEALDAELEKMAAKEADYGE